MEYKGISLFKALLNTYNNWKRENTLYKEFKNDLKLYNQAAPEYLHANGENIYPCLYDKTDKLRIEPLYFLQDAWAFERIYRKKPESHVDIGSHYKFVAFLSKIIDVSVVDIRPYSVEMESIHFIQGDILNLPFENESIPSISSLCVLEHIGLGRYGDEIDPYGSEKAILEITRVLKRNGNLYVSLPVSNKNIVAFNAGRIFAIDYLFELFAQYDVVDKAFIVGKTLTLNFTPHDRFGSTILLELKKK
jgi:SAM-dependent methyltransferase